MRFQLRLLGRFAAATGSDPPRDVAITARRRRALLAYLAMQENFTESRERLADLLWADSLDKQARQSLRQALLSLRKDLEGAAPDLLVIERDTVAIKPDLVSVDARDFVQGAASTEAPELHRLTALWRGQFLDGLDIEAEPFNEWLRAERSRLNAIAAGAFERCALLLDEAGEANPALLAAERLVALDPLHEPAQRLLLRLTARHRGRDAAQARGGALIDLWRRELNAAPEPATLALLAEIRRDAVAVVRPAGPLAASPLAEASPSPDLVPSAESATTHLGPAPTVEPSQHAALDAGQNPDTTNQAQDRSRDAQPAKVPALRMGLASGVSRARRLALWSAGGLALLCVVSLAAAGMIGWFGPPAQPGATTPPATEDTSWRSPIVPGTSSPAAGAQQVLALIVLPFTPEGDQPGPEKTLASRITDDLINDLSRVPGLRVISRATSRLYEGRNIDVAELGRELGVRYVAEGSVRLQDSTLRVNAGLTEARSRLQVWSDRFERARDDRAAMQDELVRGIARQLHVGVLVEEDRRRPPAAGDATIDDLLARGWAAILRIAATGMTSGAPGYFEEVLKRQPDNVSAMVGLAAWNVTVVAMFLVKETEPHLARAETLLAQAMKKAPRASLVHYFQGILHKTRSQPHAALTSFARTLEINPSYAPAHAQVGHVLSRTGRLQEAMEHVRYAIRLSPRDHNLGLWNTFGGQIQLELGNNEAAIEWLTRAAANDPTSPFIHACLAAAYSLSGDQAAAARHASEASRLAPWLTLKIMMERVVGTSDAGFEPKQLIRGLSLAFPNPA